MVEGPGFEEDEELADRLARSGAFDDWQLVVLLDNADLALSTDKFLWATWTRFNPATDIHAKNVELKNNHIGYTEPVIIDSRMKPWYPQEVEPHPDTAKLVDERWSEYFPK